MITIAKMHPGLVGIDRFPGVFPQVILLAVLSAATGIGRTAVLAGLCYAAVAAGFVVGSLRATRARTLDPADHLAVARSVLVGGVTAIVVEHQLSATAVLPLVVIAGGALVLAAVDARRRVSELGARFGRELDAFLVLALSGYVATLLGPWVLAVGLLPYAVVAAGWVLPWLRGHRSRGRIARLQGLVLLVAAGEILPRQVAIGLVAAALVLLALSVLRLWIRAARMRREMLQPRGMTP